MTAIDQLVRDNIKTLRPYTSAREQYMDYGLTLLDANENAWGSIGMADNNQMLNRYPDPYQRAIKEKLSEVKGHLVDSIFLGNGSDEIIDLLIRIFCEPGRNEIITTTPTYGMYKVAAAINNVAVNEVPLSELFELNADEVLRTVSEHSKIIFLCSPNNPTGNLLGKSQVQKILDEFGGIIVIDEAYIDFAKDPGFIEQCTEHANLVVIQTFSKAWGLAGIRLGVGYTSKEIMYYLNRVKPPYNVNQLTQMHALTAIEDAHEINMVVARVQNGREWLRNELSQLKIVEQVYPSEANFLLVKVKQATTIFNILIDNQIVVRDRSRIQLCEGCLRITVGTEEENQRLLDILNTIEL
jgi:histidinol-phosphate aminotransferase